MDRRTFLVSGLAMAATLAMPGGVFAETTQRLPAPHTEGGMPLMQALAARHSTRSFSTQELPEQVLSDLLWAACGVNRPDGKRTSPTARNAQEIVVFAVLARGAYRYHPETHSLGEVAAKDLRHLAGTQSFVAKAPLNLVYAADFNRMSGSEEDKTAYSWADCGFVSQNVYLACASLGLATVVRASVDRQALAQALGLTPQLRILLSQTVGHSEAVG